MVLDPATGLVFLLSLSAISGTTALVLWRLHPQLKGLGILAAGNLLTAPAILSIVIRDVHGIALHNTLAITCQAALAEGLAVFMGHPAHRRFIPAAAILTAVLWEAMLAIDPDALRSRVAVFTAISLVMFGRCLVPMLTTGSWRRLDIAEIMIAGVLGLHMLTLVGRMTLTLVHPDPNFVRSNLMQGWFFLELILINTVLFFGVLLMVGTRLSLDLRRQERTLASERHLKSELRQLLHMLGHELRTPLSIIGRTIDSIRTLLVPPPPEIERQLATLAASVDRVDRLTQTLLAAERTGMMTAQPAVQDLAPIVSDAAAMLGEKWGGKRLALDLGKTPLPVLGDRDLLFTVVVNLLDNALKYSPADSVVSASLLPRDGEVELCVTDVGIGFPPEQLADIGQRFFRARNAHHVPGTGLGLYMVRTIAQRHGGRLEVGNLAGGGARVALILPPA